MRILTGRLRMHAGLWFVGLSEEAAAKIFGSEGRDAILDALKGWRGGAGFLADGPSRIRINSFRPNKPCSKVAIW